MNRRKKALAGLCALALACALLAPFLSASADGATVYQTAVNDILLPLTSDSMPVSMGGVYYVPYTVFDRDVTAVDLGVSYGQRITATDHTLTLYNLGSILTFDVNNSTCVDDKGESRDMKAILRNGKVYVPLAGVCSFFGLQNSFTPTSYGTLIRITNDQRGLNTAQFVDAAATLMRSQYNAYIKSLTPQASPSASPSGPGQNGEDPGTDKHGVQVYLAFQCTDGAGLEDILDTLDQYGVRALFFFRPEDLTASDTLIRRMVGTGHAVGLIAPEGSAEEAAQALEEGNRLLADIAHLRTHTALAGTEAQTLEGWAYWNGTVDGLPGGRTSARLARAVLDETEAKRSLAYITMDDSAVSAGALSRLLPTLRLDRYSIRLAVETELF